jgi:adenylate kinase family enzyme
MIGISFLPDHIMDSEIPPLLGDSVYSSLYRVVIHGNSGTGKSTLAKKLAQILQVPVIHLDEIHWKPNWVESSSEEMLEALNRIFEEADKSNTGWVLDGNYETKTKRIVDHVATDIICA